LAHTITLIPGDGIGPEVTEAVQRIFTAAGLKIDWDRHDAGVIAFKKHGQTLPAALLDSVKRN
jgi:isocitrate dehydrogenase (NAD+)